MAVTSIPEPLLRQMESFAKSRHHESPTRITERDAAEKAAREPKRAKRPYWMRDVAEENG